MTPQDLADRLEKALNAIDDAPNVEQNMAQRAFAYLCLTNAPAILASLRQSTPERRTGKSPRFQEISCSQCGETFGPGDHGFSQCENHKHLDTGVDVDRLREDRDERRKLEKE